MGPIIHIVDDDRSFRVAVGRFMAASGFQVAFYGSGEEILTHPPGPESGCILLDLQLPGLGGLELQGMLKEKVPFLPIVFLTGYGDIESTVLAMRAGAAEFLEKSCSSRALLDAVKRTLLDSERQRAEHERVQTLEVRVSSLTPRESDVFGLVVLGKRNKEIAYAIGTSERTVKAHRRSIMEKLETGSLAEMVSVAERLGRLHPGN